MSPKVSIQIPTYNQQQYIGRAIESALMQDYPNLEIIVADDCSTDDTEKIVRKYTDPRLRYFKSAHNIGRVANYRKSLYEYCTGDWVVNLDGDDYYTNPSFISRGVELINKYKAEGHKVMFYQALITVVNEVTGQRIPKKHKVVEDNQHRLIDNYYLDVYRRNHFFAHLTTIYDRHEAMRIGFYEFNTLDTDFESIAKLSLYGKAILDNVDAGVWNLHGQNATYGTREAFKKRGEELLRRLEGYAKVAYGKNFETHWKKKVTRETRILHLELLAEHGFFWGLLKNFFRYRTVHARTPNIFVKAFIKNSKFILSRSRNK